MKSKLNALLLISLLLSGSSLIGQKVGIHSSLGFNLSNFAGDVVNVKYYPSYAANVIVDYQLHKHVRLGAGIEYSLEGCDFEQYREYVENDTFKIWHAYQRTRIHYLKYPLFVQYEYKNLLLRSGTYLAAKIHAHGERTSARHVQGQQTDYRNSKGPYASFWYSRPTIGIRIGIGYRFGRNAIVTSFSRDLISIDNVNGGRVFNTGFRLSYQLQLYGAK